jgi:hypothetical protein
MRAAIDFAGSTGSALMRPLPIRTAPVNKCVAANKSLHSDTLIRMTYFRLTWMDIKTNGRKREGQQ